MEWKFNVDFAKHSAPNVLLLVAVLIIVAIDSTYKEIEKKLLQDG